MKVRSGKCVLGICGEETGKIDLCGNLLFVGDIVALFTMEGKTPDEECVKYFVGLAVVSSDRFTAYAGEGDKETNTNPSYYVMGIKDCAFEGCENEWRVEKVKEHSDCVPGEHWKAYGFNYTEN